MSRFGRFLILALLGFALGAGLAYWQNTQTMAPPLVTQADVDVQADADAAATSAAIAETAETVAASDAAAATPVAGSSIGGAFSLKDHNGVDVTEASWPGKMKLVFFGFTNCPDICPAGLDKLTTALNALGSDAEKIQPLFITTDPLRDTPEAMKNYLITYHSSFVGLTGTEEQVKAAEDAYKVYSAKGEEKDGQYTVDHSAFVYLMSADDKLLETFGKDVSGEVMAEKIKTHIDAVAAPAAVEGSEGAVSSEPPTEVPSGESTIAPDAAPADEAPVPATTESVPETTTEAPAETPAETPAEGAVQ